MAIFLRFRSGLANFEEKADQDTNWTPEVLIETLSCWKITKTPDWSIVLWPPRRAKSRITEIQAIFSFKNFFLTRHNSLLENPKSYTKYVNKLFDDIQQFYVDVESIYHKFSNKTRFFSIKNGKNFSLATFGELWRPQNNKSFGGFGIIQQDRASIRTSEVQLVS